MAKFASVSCVWKKVAYFCYLFVFQLFICNFTREIGAE